METQNTQEAGLPLLELKQVTKSFRSGERELQILKGLDLSIEPGETIAITGPSGSGKSTLLGLLAGLDRVTSGAILHEGEKTTDWDEERFAQWRRVDVGFVFQDFRLIPSFTALENITLPLEILGVSNQEAHERAQGLLAELGLAERGDHFPNQLSGGEQQRVAICRAYAHGPRLIFADEPTGNLDPETSEQVMRSLLGMNERRQTTLILVTHDMELADTMGRKVALKDGRIAP